MKGDVLQGAGSTLATTRHPSTGRQGSVVSLLCRSWDKPVPILCPVNSGAVLQCGPDCFPIWADSGTWGKLSKEKGCLRGWGVNLRRGDHPAQYPRYAGHCPPGTAKGHPLDPGDIVLSITRSLKAFLTRSHWSVGLFHRNRHVFFTWPCKTLGQTSAVMFSSSTEQIFLLRLVT